MAEQVAQDVSALLTRARQGEPQARGALFELYRPYLKIWAAHAIGMQMQRRFDASDVAQNAVAAAARDFHEFQGTGEAEFSCWITQILRHQLANLVRDHRASKRDVDRERPLALPTDSAALTWIDPAADTSTPSQKVVRGERSLRLAELLAGLPEDQGEAVRLRHLEGRSIDEIAEIMERSATAAAGLIKRGLQTLRKKMSTDSWM